ncbi:hypothetical protein WJM97_13695 [Okeanomitos corallinicola TIOX110]|uniref:Uncharacterized protein n=1 Tax=Okeanomitos corallinicola TIOX110 TaxID=3133117 RepID=A0ABZ2USE3_9CYAN
MSLEQIAQVTELSLEEVQTLQKETQPTIKIQNFPNRKSLTP